MKAKFLLLTILLFLIYRSNAQQVVDANQVISDIIEELAASSEIEQDYSDLVEDLHHLAENPINLNAASKTELQKLFFLSDFQIESLLSYRDSTGKILSIYELQLVPGYDLIDVERLTLFVVAGEVIEPVKPSDFTKGKYDISTRFKTFLQTPGGYRSSNSESNYYLGSKYALYSRFRYKANRLQVGVNAEKDSGEPFLNGTFPTGFDYLSGYAQLSNMGKVKRFVVGDFRCEFGQGLTFWNSLTFGKSANIAGFHKRGRGTVPHSSATESNFLRGAAITLNFSNIDLSLITSYNRIDGNLVDTLSTGEQAFSSLPETGYHRTFSEIENRRNIPELIVGANASVTFSKLKVGATAIYSKIYGENYKTLPVYSLTPFATEKLSCGIYSDLYYNQHLFYGEVGVDILSQKMAALIGGLLKLSSRVQLSVLGRSYSITYNPRYTAALAEGTGKTNEQGLLTGISLLAAKGWKISGYIDLFRFPWMHYGVYAPSQGRDFLLQSEHVLNASWQLSFRYRFKQDERNLAGSNLTVIPIISQIRQDFRTLLLFQPTQQVVLKSVVGISVYKSDSLLHNEYGYFLAQDIGLNLQKVPLNIRMRFAIFDTKTWNTRIYSYENDMLYSFTVPASYSSGTRLMLMVKYSYSKNADLWIRFAQTYYSKMDEIGTGLDKIDGNTRSELKVMLRVKF